MRRAIGAALVVLLVGCSGGGDPSTSAADDVGARQAALPTSTTQATTTQAPTTVAPASQLLEVPDLVGRSVDYAEGALTAVGLVLVVETREDADSEAGVIFEQLPEAGGETTPGSPVVARIPAPTTTTTSSDASLITTTAVASTTATPATTTTNISQDAEFWSSACVGAQAVFNAAIRAWQAAEEFDLGSDQTLTEEDVLSLYDEAGGIADRQAGLWGLRSATSTKGLEQDFGPNLLVVAEQLKKIRYGTFSQSEFDTAKADLAFACWEHSLYPITCASDADHELLREETAYSQRGEECASEWASTKATKLAVVLDEEAILTFAYEWGPSDETAALQTLLGLTSDGWYGAGTQAAHIAELEARGLTTDDVPSRPTTTTTTQVPTTTTGVPTTTTEVSTTTSGPPDWVELRQFSYIPEIQSLQTLCDSSTDWDCITFINFATSHIGSRSSGCTYDQVRQFILDDLAAEPDWPLQIERECDHLVVGGDSSPHVFSLGEMWMLSMACPSRGSSFEGYLTCGDVVYQATKQHMDSVELVISQPSHNVSTCLSCDWGVLDERYISLCSYTEVMGLVQSRIWEQPEWPMTVEEKCG